MKIKKCDWECKEERDGICIYLNKSTSECECKECECFFNCNNCKQAKFCNKTAE